MKKQIDTLRYDIERTMLVIKITEINNNDKKILKDFLIKLYEDVIFYYQIKNLFFLIQIISLILTIIVLYLGYTFNSSIIALSISCLLGIMSLTVLYGCNIIFKSTRITINAEKNKLKNKVNLDKNFSELIDSLLESALLICSKY